MLDPRLTNSVGLFQIASLTSNRLVRYPFSDEAANTTDLTLKGDLAESWQGSHDFRVWTFKLRKDVKWQTLPPLNGREVVAADIKYCYEAYAKEGVQSFTFQEIEGIETPDKYTVRIHLKTANTMFPQNLAEPVSVIFPREVLEEDGDLKKRLIGTGPFIRNSRECSSNRMRASSPLQAHVGSEAGSTPSRRGLQHAPVNEQGVVFLFGMICRELGYVVEIVKQGFPDCEAKRRVRGKPGMWQLVRIEFEYQSRNFRQHSHDPD